MTHSIGTQTVLGIHVPEFKALKGTLLLTIRSQLSVCGPIIPNVLPPRGDDGGVERFHAAFSLVRSKMYLSRRVARRARVKAGDRVRRGQVLAHVGDSGDSREPDL